MSRVKRGVTARARHKKVMDKAKGYYGARSRVFRVAKRPSPRPRSMRTAIAVSASVSSARCGSCVSTPRPI